MIASKMYFLTKNGISKTQGFLLVLYEFVFQILTSFLIGIPFLAFLVHDERSFWLVLICMIFMGICIHPRILKNIVSFIGKRKNPHFSASDIFLGIQDIGKYCSYYTLTHILKGASF